MGGPSKLVGRRTTPLCALVLAALVALAALPALARAATYVAMGDSYSSGVGTGSYYADSASCKRSPHAYPVNVARRIGRGLRFVACSGARTTDVLNTQVRTLNPWTRRVTISVGGNDAGFSSVIGVCARPWPWTCWSDIHDAQTFIRNTLPGLLNRVYGAIDSRSPSAVVAVVGYPRLFNPRNPCIASAGISSGEEAELNETADLLATVTSRRARARGFTYVVPNRRFPWHAVCDSAAWINGLSFPIVESFHPNRAGHDAYADLLTPAID
jgi:lysophospholipase L1-like esterase